MPRRIFGLIGIFNVLFAVFATLLGSSPARAALECDQLVAVAQASVKLRDEGLSLSVVLREIERGDLQQKLDAQEINLLRQVVRMSFTSEASVNEIAEACKAGELGLPKPKPKP